MVLSAILSKLLDSSEYDIYNEKEFDTLGLTASKLEGKCCTFLDNIKYLEDIKENVVMILVTREVYEPILTRFGNEKGICITENPRETFFKLHNLLADTAEYTRVVFPTQIGTGCQISSLASIAENNVIIGNNVIIEEFVAIRENTEIKDNTIIRAGAKIGGQGFEYKRIQDGIMGVSHLGGVKIGHDVEVQYNTCIDRAVYPWDDTIIGNYTKIDNLVHVGHAAKICDNVMIVAQVGIGGRTIIKDNTWIGFGATVSNGLVIGENSRANIGSVVTKNVCDREAVTGNFAINHQKFIQNLKKANANDER